MPLHLTLFLYAILGDLDFSRGKWTLVGVSLPNYAPHPLQQRFSAFLLQDSAILCEMQKLWVGRTFYEDYCDYHFALKLYEGRTLRKTLKVNLRCGYITEGVFSYSFSPEWLERFASAFRPIYWSRVWFRYNERLQLAVRALLEAEEVFFYEEPEPYLFEGKFILAWDSLPWRVDRDSLYRAVQAKVMAAFPPGRVYVRPYFFYLDDKALLHFRFEVFCNRVDFEAYGRRLPFSVSWQPHIQPGEAKRLILIGVNREKFLAYVHAWQQKHGAVSEMPD
ncbi:MAG: hypothetical protein NZ958_03430 [Bacteroidia bacterium]|nr:hypothetical protein [Bacteroidia bacterium]MDW8088270.1 hypothetical protein [Bacteroidia bacterium]